MMDACPFAEEYARSNWANEFMDTWADRAARPAMVWVRRDGRHRLLTFGHFADRVERFANLLANLGVAAGESVVVLLPFVPEWWEVAAGAMRAGVPFAPVPCGAGAAGLTAKATAATAGVLVVDEAHLEAALATRRACPSVRHVLCVGGLPRADAVNYHAVMHLEEPEHEPVVPGDPVLITGTAPVSGHGRTDLLREWADLGLERLDLRTDDLHFNGIPRETVAGFLLGLVHPWSAGAAILVDETGGDQDRALLERFPVTTVSAPGSWYAELAAAESGSLRHSALRRLLATGGQPDAGVAQAWFRETGLRIHPGPVRAESPVAH